MDAYLLVVLINVTTYVFHLEFLRNNPEFVFLLYQGLAHLPLGLEHKIYILPKCVHYKNIVSMVTKVVFKLNVVSVVDHSFK